MVAALRNNGRPGISSMAVAAMDVALWDLKAKLLSVPLASAARTGRGTPSRSTAAAASRPTPDSRLRSQLSDWVEQGISMVKMKIGRDPARDPARVRVAREAIGPDVAAVRRRQRRLPSGRAAIATAFELDAEGVQLVRGARLLR